MNNKYLNELWEGRKKPGSPVRHHTEGRGVDSDFMTVQIAGLGHVVFERKPNTTEWVRVPE